MDERALNDIAAALLRLAPPRADADLERAPGYVWSPRGLEAVEHIDAMPLCAFAGIDQQREALTENFRRHAAGRPAHDTLLWGARGMGKSALVRAAAVEAGTVLVQIDGASVGELALVFRRLAPIHRPFIVFVDDLGIDEAASLRRLRSVLDGGIEARPTNAILAVTANRRHIVDRTLAENEAAAAPNPRDVLDDRLALADRFGLWLGFHNADQAAYLAICESLAAEAGIAHDADAALAFARARGARSGRIAAHFVTEQAGRSR